MSVLVKCDVNDSLSLKRSKGRGLISQARTDKAHSLEIAPERPRTNRSAFLDDFTLEHTLAGQQFPVIEMTGSF